MAGLLLPFRLDGAVHHGANAIWGQLGRARAPHGHPGGEAEGNRRWTQHLHPHQMQTSIWSPR